MSMETASEFGATNVPHVRLQEPYFEAIAYASGLHAGQVRKGKQTAYICHPLGVSALVLEANGDQEQAIIGLLHDAAEDCGGEPILDEIARRFGSRVADGVRGCSDSLVEDPQMKERWNIRKTRHFEHLRSSASEDVIIVTAADKLHNARAIWTDLQLNGVDALRPFKFPSQVTWYYDQMLQVLQDRKAPTILTKQLDDVVTSMNGFLKGKVLPEPRDPNA